MQTRMNDKVLIVDDEAVTRELLDRHLSGFGYAIAQAQSGEQAIELARQSDFASILLDLNMPGIDGIETCRRVRALPRHQMTPILVVTARDESEALSEAFAAGCNDFLVKPFNPVVLEARLKSHIQRTGLYYQLEQVRKTLNRYISPRTQQMVEEYASTGHAPPPRKQQLCILFTDIRGFTQLSQHMAPEKLFTLLSKHLAYQVELVYQYEGYVDKYAGDGIMAVFEGDKMAQRGCQCASRIINHAKKLVQQEHNPMFAVGCGLHQGEAVIGNIGSPEHLDYSVVGETVNLAARLCGHAEPMSVIVSDNVFKALQHEERSDFAPGQRIRVKGFEQAITVHELNDPD